VPLPLQARCGNGNADRHSRQQAHSGRHVVAGNGPALTTLRPPVTARIADDRSPDHRYTSLRRGSGLGWQGPVSLGNVDPSKPNDPRVDRAQPIPRSRPADDGVHEVLEGEIIERGVPLGRPQPGPPPSPPSPPRPPTKPGKTRRTVLWTLLGIVALICLAGSITTYVLYSKATTPERGTPAVSLQQYVTAKFGSRDESRERLFTCEGARLRPVDDLLNQIKTRESQTGVGIQVTMSDATVVEQGESATIQANLDIAAAQANGGTSVVVQRWEFSLRNANGWRVCSATKVG
jgi:hypothetical protein